MPYRSYKSTALCGFTLIEMSIVLVVIGLVVGVSFVGRDLIDAASQRAQIAQVDKYNTAVHTFQIKYGYLPGDIPNPYASQFGFQTRGTLSGEGDGNDVLEGNCSQVSSSGFDEGGGELAVFWQDLTLAGLINESVATGAWPSTTACTSISDPQLINQWLPNAKLGNGNFIYLFSFNSTNYFGLSSVDGIGWSLGTHSLTPGVTIQQAYNIDRKIDDGLPQSGNVMACYVNSTIYDHHGVWAAGGGLQGSGTLGYIYNCTPTTDATPYAVTNCYDNNNVAGTQKYQLLNASIQNCALSFAFQ